MNREAIEPELSFRDPESRLRFERTDGGMVVLRYRDWRNREIILQFTEVMHFTHGFLPPNVGCAAGEFSRLSDSPLLARMREERILENNEIMFHYLLGFDDVEWCEVVASSHGVAVEAG